eukprot:COSAG02_NODE_5159_length_4582_cov_3.745483_2_plen_94_part_00
MQTSVRSLARSIQPQHSMAATHAFPLTTNPCCKQPLGRSAWSKESKLGSKIRLLRIQEVDSIGRESFHEAWEQSVAAGHDHGVIPVVHHSGRI